MHNYFLAKIRYEKTNEDGLIRKTTESYLVDALSFTECEARVIQEMEAFISGEFQVADIKRANYSELFVSDEESADKWYDARLAFITLDERSGKEKRSYNNILVQAADLNDALKKLNENMKGTLCDYESVKIQETLIMDVYQYNK